MFAAKIQLVMMKADGKAVALSLILLDFICTQIQYILPDRLRHIGTSAIKYARIPVQRLKNNLAFSAINV